MNTLLLGGGLDSTAYLILLRPELDNCVIVDYGQIAFEGELKSSQYFCDKYKLPLYVHRTSQIMRYNGSSPHQPKKAVGMLFSGDLNDNPYVNGRNLSLILAALEYGDNIYLGFTDPGYKPFPDADQEFVELANTLVKKCFASSSVRAPFVSTNRLEVFKRAYALDPELFDKSSTCWVYKDGECGECKHCLLKEQQQREVYASLSSR